MRQYPDEYDIEIIEFGGVPELREAHKLVVSRTNRGNNLDFRKGKKSDILLTIPVKYIELVAPVRQTRGIRGKEHFVIEMTFKKKPFIGTGPELFSILLNVDQEYNDVLQSHVEYLKDVENSPTFQRQIKSDMHPESCSEFLNGISKSSLMTIKLIYKENPIEGKI